ncbi:MAG: hypothetical protein SFX74_05745 [Fimbriimonadaceae bacterium]|nr:hypothetical protein [Fimbriimonadaceae bacterium]
MKTAGGLSESMRRVSTPVTVGLCALLGIAALAFFFSQGQIFTNVALVGSAWFRRPWTLLTYPFAYSPLSGMLGPILLLFLMAWLYQVGSQLETIAGSKRFGITVAAFIAFGGALLGGSLLAMGRAELFVAGPTLLVSCLTVMWATRNPGLTVMLMGLIPVNAKILMGLTALFVLVSVGAAAPVLGLIALIPLVAAWAFADGRIPNLALAERRVPGEMTKAARERQEQMLADAARRERDRIERDRLKELFERSGIEDR